MLKPVVATASARRTAVHLLLIAAATTSLVLEPELTAHILLGLVFVALVIAHVFQRQRAVRALVYQLPRFPRSRSIRMAQADAWLTVVTIAMLASGIADWTLGHPTRIRWQAITGVLLAITIVVHTLRRRRRLRHSHVR